MKRILSWIVVVAIIITISVLLFITGKKHKIVLLNGTEGVEVPAKVMYIVDGQNAEKPKSIRANKKGVVYVKGVNHKITLKFKDSENNDQEITKKFKAKLSEDMTIDFAKIIDGSEDWLSFKEEEPESEEE